MIGEGDCGEIGGMKIGKGNPKYSEKTYSFLLRDRSDPRATVRWKDYVN
jgi:hypothetical protein